MSHPRAKAGTVIATVTASPTTVQVLALIAAVVFLVVAVGSLAGQRFPPPLSYGLTAVGLALLSVAIIYLV